MFDYVYLCILYYIYVLYHGVLIYHNSIKLVFCIKKLIKRFFRIITFNYSFFNILTKWTQTEIKNHEFILKSFKLVVKILAL